MTAFRDYIEENTFLTGEETDRVMRLCLVRKIPRRQHLLREGTIWKWHVFVMKGCLRIYHVDPGEKVKTVGFALGGSWTGDRESMATGKPSRFNIHALQDSEVTLIADTEFQALRKSIAGFNALANHIILKSFRQCQERIFTSLSYTIDEKYAHFREEFPEIADSIPKNMIASYLGISSEYFSRSQTGKSLRKK
jgi:CRP-like cAMP-binding protein